MTSKRNIAIGIAILGAIAVSAYLYFGMSGNGPVVITPVDSGQGASHDITQADNGKTVAFKKGDRFVLKLGEMDWTLSIKPDGIISRVKNIAMIRGAQGIYTADKAGTAVISAEGRPVCATGQMCAQYIVNFTATVVVK